MRTAGPRGQLLHQRGATHAYLGLLPLMGEHQADNTDLALAAAEAFLEPDGSWLDPAAARCALRRVAAPGRLEKLRDTPSVVVAVSHNPAGMAVGVAELRRAAADLVAVTAQEVLGADRVFVETRMDAAIAKALNFAKPGHRDNRPVVLVTGSVANRRPSPLSAGAMTSVRSAHRPTVRSRLRSTRARRKGAQ